MEVIAFALSYLKNRLKQSLIAKAAGVPGVQINLAEFHWVITVPAIWTPQAKQMMREAACLVSYFPFNLIRYYLIVHETHAWMHAAYCLMVIDYWSKSEQASCHLSY